MTKLSPPAHPALAGLKSERLRDAVLCYVDLWGTPRYFSGDTMWWHLNPEFDRQVHMRRIIRGTVVPAAARYFYPSTTQIERCVEAADALIQAGLMARRLRGDTKPGARKTYLEINSIDWGSKSGYIS